MGTDIPYATACPHCGATVRPGAPYCSLCHADFRPRPAAPALAEAPVVAPAPVAAYASAVDPLTAPLLDVALPQARTAAPPAAVLPQRQAPVVPAPRAAPQWPCHSCGVSNALSDSACVGCGAGFLAAASEKLSVVVPGVGDVTRMSKGALAALGAGAAGALGLVLTVLAFLGRAVG